jgi:hypothetical protein
MLNIDKYFACESRDMSDESGTYIILLKLKTIFEEQTIQNAQKRLRNRRIILFKIICDKIIQRHIFRLLV